MIIIIKETAAGRLIYCKDVKRMRYGQTGEDTPQYTDRLRCAFILLLLLPDARLFDEADFWLRN